MRFIKLLTGPVYVVEVRFASDGTHTAEAWECRSRGSVKPIAYQPAKAAKHPVVLSLSGHGVITKSLATERIAQQVEAAPDTFIRTRNEETISFLRRERTLQLQQEFTDAGIYPQCICVGTPPAAAARSFFDSVRWKDAIRPTDTGSSLAQSIARRAACAVLGTLMPLLFANALGGPKLDMRHRKLLEQSARNEEKTARARLADTQLRELTLRFASQPSMPHTLLCDHIAASVPEHIVLTQLAVEPLTGRFAAEQPLPRREHTAIVCGMAPAADDIAEFVERLGKIEGCRAVRLHQVERERNGERLTFRIEYLS